MIRLTPPTTSGYVSSTWGADRSYRGGWHAGLDFPDEDGAPMLAAADGVVSYVRDHSASFAGKFIVIDHGDGISTRYLHARSIRVLPGQRVKRGEVIGEVGSTGTTSSKPHVHFDVKLKPEALERYRRLYGAPTTGFSAEMKPWGVGVPTEPLMDLATYRPSAIQASLKKGVKPYRASGGLTLALGLAAGFGWLLYEFVFK